MPTYQYHCTECGRDLEVQQSFSDASLTECPACQGRLRKVFNAVGVVFKGSGFYRNDSRSSENGSKDGGKTDGTSDTKTDTKSDAKADTKSDSKTEKKSDAKTPATNNGSSSSGSKTSTSA